MKKEEENKDFRRIKRICGSCNSKKHDKVIKYEPEK